MSGATILSGDCRTVLPTLDADSFDACVTDPPYELGFMGKSWDRSGVANDAAMWSEVLRVLKPGAHLLAFGGTRTRHRMVSAVEDAGFEIRDEVAWTYGSGFPKSHNLDGEWDGWGTALKPAWEPIVVARKPLSEKTVALNVARWNTGAINIRACRIEFASERDRWKPEHHRRGTDPNPMDWGSEQAKGQMSDPSTGRWPANLIHDGSQGVLELFPETAPSRAAERGLRGRHDPAQGMEANRFKDYSGGVRGVSDAGGSASRFFYCAKASKADRAGSNHPTVKPRALMRYLCRLVTPSGGTVLDPFAGSGTTLYAARDEGFGAIGIELDPGYFGHIAERLGLSTSPAAEARAPEPGR